MPYETKEELLKLGEIDPEFAAFLKDNPLPPVVSDVTEFKEASKSRLPLTLKLLGPPPPEVRVTETSYTTRDGFINRAKLFQPTSPPGEESPLVILIHGGGFCVGTPESEEQTARNLTQSFGAVCVSIAYRLAPEFTFPHAINDCWDAVLHFASTAVEIGADPTKGFIIGGTSAGGNLTAVLAHKARDEHLNPPLTGQWLAVPAVCPPDELPEKYQKYSYSFVQNEHAPILPVAIYDMFTTAYQVPKNNAELYAALNHPRGHEGLPPAFFQIDGMDPLRDEGLIYERVLREEAGVKTKLDVYPGVPHAHWGFFPMLKSSKKFRADQIQGFAWLLNRTPQTKESQLEAAPIVT